MKFYLRNDKSLEILIDDTILSISDTKVLGNNFKVELNQLTKLKINKKKNQSIPSFFKSIFSDNYLGERFKRNRITVLLFYKGKNMKGVYHFYQVNKSNLIPVINKINTHLKKVNQI